MVTLPPGPAFIPQKYYVNLQKAGMPILTLVLMTYFDNWSLGCWIYFMLHGSYGTWWLLKGMIFPDYSFESPVTFMSAIGGWVFCLGPYCIAVW